MLTREHAIAAFEGRRILPDRLTRGKHAHYLDYARRMCEIYSSGIGQTRQALHRQVRGLFADEEDCPARRIEAFCKLLDERCEYHRDSRGEAAALRMKIYRAAAALHPLVDDPDPWFENQQQAAKESIATTLGSTWPDLADKLFADILDFHRLKSFEAPTPALLLARYNVAQIQVALYDAISLTVVASTDVKSLLRYAKLAGLMHRIERCGAGQYRIEFDGPASLLHSTHRYGVCMARFLPGLLSCRDWKLRAVLKTPRRGFQTWLELDSTSGLTSEVDPAQEFDSQVEQKFAERWGSEPRDGWRMLRESEILHRGQKVFVPDFTFIHASGRTALLEIIGFWTPEYLAHKRELLELFRDDGVLLAVHDSLQDKLPLHDATVIPYKTALKPSSVLEVLNQLLAPPADGIEPTQV
jgi:uncharacterized protein